MKVDFGAQTEANGSRTYVVFIEDEHVADLVGSAHTLYDGDKSVRRGLRGQAYRIVLREDAPPFIRDMFAPAMPDDGRSFFTITMARNAIRDLANNRRMRLPEGWAPPKVTAATTTGTEKSKPATLATGHGRSRNIKHPSGSRTEEQRVEKASSLSRLSTTDIMRERTGRREQQKERLTQEERMTLIGAIVRVGVGVVGIGSFIVVLVLLVLFIAVGAAVTCLSDPGECFPS